MRVHIKTIYVRRHIKSIGQRCVFILRLSIKFDQCNEGRSSSQEKPSII